MKTHTQSQTALAVLTATTGNIGWASLALSESSDDGWQQLLPAGHFTAIDGRPFDVPGGKWFIDASIAQRLIAQLSASVNDLVIDYEHQTLLADKNGKPAPAAGWFKDVEWRDGSGLWIKPNWTSRAAEFIKNGEYRFLSAVFPYSKETGEPLSLHSAALVNRPGIDGMKAVAALCAQYQTSSNHSEDSPMDEKLKALLAKLGVNVDEGQQPTEAQMQSAMAALSALKTKADDADSANQALAALKAKGSDDVDLSKFVPVATYQAAVVELAQLKANGHEKSIEQVIADAKQEGRVFAAEEEYLTQFGEQQGVAALKGMLATRPAVAALKGQQTQDTAPPKKGEGADQELSAEDLAVLKATGISKEDFLKSKQELN